MKSLRILQFCASSGPQSGGMETQVIKLSNALSSSNDVYLIADQSLATQADKAVQRYAFPSHQHRRHPGALNRLRALISQIQPDIIHAHGLKAVYMINKVIGELINKAKPFKTVVTIHGYKSKLPHLKHIDCFIGVSEEIAEGLRKAGLPYHLIPNGIEQSEHQALSKQTLCESLALEPSLPLLLAAGRLAAVKQYDLLLNACKELPVNLLIAGDGPLFADLSLLLSERTRLLGHRDDVQALMRAADAVVICSKREGMSLTMLEALANKTPVLSTPVSGAKSLLPEISLINAESAATLQKSLGAALEDLGALEKSQQPVFENVRNEFSLTRMTEKTNQLYAQLTARPDMLFLGDCNTCGTESLLAGEGKPYPLLISEHTTLSHLNCGLTMSTTREALAFFEENTHPDLKALFIQYGLVDSWRTIRAAPYVAYYPDSGWRRFLRRWVKKWKKYGRRLGLGKLFGMQNQVPIEEYVANIESLIRSVSCPVFLIETAPNKDNSRNEAIRTYNAALKALAEKYSQTHLVYCYEVFDAERARYYSDPTHFSQDGHQQLAELILNTPAFNTMVSTNHS